MQEKFSLFEHILISLRRPRVGDSKEPTQWPSEASCAYQSEYGEEVAGSCRRRSFFRLLIEEYNFDSKAVPESLYPVVDSLKALKKETSDYMRFIWAQGELYEDYIIQMAKNTGIFMHTQVPIYVPQYGISGKLDLIIVDPFSGMLHVIEAKSVYGHGGTKVLGTPAARNNGYLGIPKDSNLLQAAIYEWWWASKLPNYGHTKLVYGDRGTGYTGEFEVAIREETTEDGTKLNRIWYFPMCRKGEWVSTPYTIEGTLEAASRNRKAIASGEIPPRDFYELYTREQVSAYYETGRLTRKTDIAQWESHLAREKENEERVAQGKKPKIAIKYPEIGDFHCNYCDYSEACSKIK